MDPISFEGDHDPSSYVNGTQYRIPNNTTLKARADFMTHIINAIPLFHQFCILFMDQGILYHDLQMTLLKASWHNPMTTLWNDKELSTIRKNISGQL